MKIKSLAIIAALSGIGITACQQAETGAWADFKKCASNDCVREAVAVKDAFLKDPKTLFAQFAKSGEAGEDHFIGWLYILRDSVLVNSKMGTTEERFGMQQAVVTAAQGFQDDPKVGDLARSIAEEIGMLAIASELEDDIVLAQLLSEPLTGTFGFDLGGTDGTGTVKIRRLSLDQFQFDLAVTGRAPAHNMGMMAGVVKDFNQETGVGTYSTAEFGGEGCSLEFRFEGDTLKIKSLKGEPFSCGFGNGIMADGKYARESFDDPFLSKAEAKTAKNLVGNWVSLDDPKAGIRIEKGVYTDTYEGSDADAPTPFTYFSKCPGDCQPTDKLPCLKRFGQDEVCYSIVMADGKALHLSMIGGRGNTLRFKKN